MKKHYRNFEEARRFTHNLNLISRTCWKKTYKIGKIPKDIPLRPERAYKKQWKGWQDWLGYEKRTFWKKDWRYYDDAKKFVHKLGLGSKSIWSDYCKSRKIPSDIPHTPELVYKGKGWNGWQDWLGYEKPRTSADYFNWREFHKSREFVCKLKLVSEKKWIEYCKSGKKPKNIPIYPDAVYKNKGWIGWGDFLCTNRIANQDRKYWNYEDAANYVRKLNLKNQNDWADYRKSEKLPKYIPSIPWRVYETKGWIGLWDWLGTEKPKNYKRDYLSYDEAKSVITKFKISGKNYWSNFCKSGKKPVDIPSNPDAVYKNKGWIGWGDFLGTGIIANKNRVYIPFEQAKEFAQKLKLANRDEWNIACKAGKVLSSIPFSPAQRYKNKGWIGWGDFLGTGNISNVNRSKSYLKFINAKEEARKIAKKHNLRTLDDWIKAVQDGKIPTYLPQRPDRIYSKKSKT